MAICDDIWGHWNCDEITGTRADSSGNSRDLLEAGLPVGSSAGIILLAADMTDVPGYTRYLALPGVDDTPDVGGPFAVGFWYKHTPGANPEINALQVHLSKEDDLFGGSVDIDIFVMYNGALSVNDNIIFNSFSVNLPTGNIFPTGVWHHVILNVSAANGTEIYVNGAFVVSNPAGFAYPVVTPRPSFYVLSTDNDVGGEILLDELCVWERALTPAEIASLYNGGAGMAFTCGPVTLVGTIEGLAYDATGVHKVEDLLRTSIDGIEGLS